MEDKILYHGSIVEIDYPEDNRTFSLSTDFGLGFYLTEIKSQTERWTTRKFSKEVERLIRADRLERLERYEPTVSVYALDYEEVISKFRSKYFDSPSDECLIL